ncbi:Peptidase M23 [Desulfovibrio sp. X2]|uniref:murein hydrolase activator EnvC family protein n=1 Tax=Desulfovibrio sp. X2 TaxID=941449 RepID=UPI000358CE96|nr:peptidoglycan DD-metalloendopeptidase family protein [Desulfovibrio sp. X2]EPR42400.1 Peptidase M23 [Desulfovibrio sp. X2]
MRRLVSLVRRLRLSLGLGLVLVALAAAPLSAARAKSSDKGQVNKLKQSIEQQNARAKQQKESLSKLSQRERALFGKLAGAEDRVNSLTADIMRQEREMAAVEKKQKEIAAEHDRIEDERTAVLRDLGRILAALWPLHLENATNKLKGLSSWEEADRRFTWLSALYGAGGDKLAALAARTSELAANMAEQDRLRADVQKRLDTINSRKDDLLEQKLALSKDIQKVRAEKVSQEEELNQIVSTVEGLKYRLKVLTSRDLGDFKGSLPWPADGRLAVRFNPGGNPPVRGLGISASDNTQVRAVSWGKVVHDDVLRGFGKVIILYHGGNYYSLYAYLSESDVRMGQEVEKDEVLGRVGYYPEIKGPGLYFELRWHEKAVNPLEWLSARKK